MRTSSSRKHFLVKQFSLNRVMNLFAETPLPFLGTVPPYLPCTSILTILYHELIEPSFNPWAPMLDSFNP
ncbi:hypothetical protein CAEBREN_13936 [Caenorhabditis brenneri]|uniref:Uncharacterized protein n=1 Tax=Caenorhabditis brenneri TaxID=135651 RepID=G0PFG5_CAEBE|nr:hypothetical protein CAEBREN_13936 [Caenorhabditis brenneri]